MIFWLWVKCIVFGRKLFNKIIVIPASVMPLMLQNYIRPLQNHKKNISINSNFALTFDFYRHTHQDKPQNLFILDEILRFYGF